MFRNIVAAALALACACGGAGGAPQAWHLDAIRADPGRALGTGLGIVIALVDTGFTSLPMPGLAGRLLNPGSGDPNGHGTAMAVIAAGGGDLGVWGVAPAALVLPEAVAGADGHASPRALAQGIRRAVAGGAWVINVSLADEVPSPEVAAAVREALTAGSVVVAAAGDLGLLGPDFPASEPGVIAVYGQDRAGQVGVHSNLPEGGVEAPGERIKTVVPTAAGLRRQLINGTSAAAAVVSGVLAACLSVAARRLSSRTAQNSRCTQLLLRGRQAAFLDLNQILEAVR